MNVQKYARGKKKSASPRVRFRSGYKIFIIAGIPTTRVKINFSQMKSTAVVRKIKFKFYH